MLKIHYLCGDKDNKGWEHSQNAVVVICSKFITFAVTKTTIITRGQAINCCDLLKIHYLCGDKDNKLMSVEGQRYVVICSKFITFAVTKTTLRIYTFSYLRCDLLKIHYLCGDKDNRKVKKVQTITVVICSKFITFAVTKTTHALFVLDASML